VVSGDRGEVVIEGDHHGKGLGTWLHFETRGGGEMAADRREREVRREKEEGVLFVLTELSCKGGCPIYV
jgi:hypothetical protein